MTFLQHVGSILRKVLHIGIEAAQDAEPAVDLAFPQLAPLYNSAVGLAFSTEATIPTLTGTGEQKLTQLAANFVPGAQAWAKANNITWPAAAITKWASAVVDTINLIPAPIPPALATVKVQPSAATLQPAATTSLAAGAA